jgi:hypothetical protein
MTPADTAKVLLKLAAYDQRTTGESDVAAWYEVIGPLHLQDALAAVTAHYREQAHRAMPADIRKLAMRIRDDRTAQHERHDRQAAIEAAPSTTDRSAAVTALIDQVAANLPQPDLYERAKARARAERGRPPPQPARRQRRRQPPKDEPAPIDSQIATLAARYLRDGHEPAAVAGLLGVSRRWCQRAARELGVNPQRAAEALAHELAQRLRPEEAQA